MGHRPYFFVRPAGQNCFKGIFEFMSKRDFKDYICRPFCRFFREGEKEEMACLGAKVLEYLVGLGRLNSEDLPRHGKDPHLWAERDGHLRRYLCTYCDFYAEDCDFQSQYPPPGSEPCGGYVLLSLLMEKGMIDIIDLKETAGESSKLD